MTNRIFWKKQIEEAWKHRSILWLSGIRRVGKTYLCQSLADTEYYDCELPLTRIQLENPEHFLSQKNNKRLVLDEIHRLDNPSELLKIAADHYPNTKIIATGSSTLSASKKFKDTLTGRKIELWLTPMLLDESSYFGNSDLQHRLLQGGLPPFFLSETLPFRDYQEWLDAYWARDIQELFRLEKRYSFLKFTEMILAQSGSIFDATRFSTPCEVSRTTIMNYLAVLEATFVAHIIRPFSQHRPTEIISAPKVYGFDTGFVCYSKGWTQLRKEDMGLLWKHCVLNEMQGYLQTKKAHYWRDKQGHEIDFIWMTRENANQPTAIECKWSINEFNPKNMQAFRKNYPTGKNFVVSPEIKESFEKPYHGINVQFVNSKNLVEWLQN
jgi:uncharacterized protein